MKRFGILMETAALGAALGGGTVAAGMALGCMDLKIVLAQINADFACTFDIEHSDSSPYDLTGVSLEMQVKNRTGSTAALGEEAGAEEPFRLSLLDDAVVVEGALGGWFMSGIGPIFGC